MRRRLRLLLAIPAALALSFSLQGCASVSEKDHVYFPEDSDSGVTRQPWNRPSDKFDNGAMGNVPQSR